MLALSPAPVGIPLMLFLTSFPDSTLSGRLSRLPPKTDDGASARTEASVSILLLRLRLLDEARVRMDALSVRRLLAVAEVYVVGGPPGWEEVSWRCRGIAEAV